uniref:Uncharacterized protein n=1 Tax=Pseudoalteromonas translucida (strain TAC 125) TaxID=326442 RepID=A0A6G6AS38_PSET1|nr:hypothetical protein PSHA_p00020 [Pseudoalteromonas translucida TAC125]
MHKDLKKAQGSIQAPPKCFDGLDKNQVAEVIKLTESLKHQNQTHGAICSRGLLPIPSKLNLSLFLKQ